MFLLPAETGFAIGFLKNKKKPAESVSAEMMAAQNKEAT